MPGMDRNSGTVLDGWPHVEQSIGVLLTTPKKSRVMRRQVGSGIQRRVDAPIAPATLIDLYADVAEAITNYEPRFRPVRMSIPNDPTSGTISLLVEGIYFPRGDLGDFSVSVPKTAGVSL